MWPTLIPILGNLLDRILPDQKASDEAKLKMYELVQNGQLKELEADVQLATGQLDINKVEAANPNVFISGWRPFIGWICGFGCAWNWIGLPIGLFIAEVMGHHLVLSRADLSEMLPLLLGMLGLGGLRTYEKYKGVSK